MDVAHPVVVEWLKSKAPAPTAPAKKSKAAPPAPTPAPLLSDPDELLKAFPSDLTAIEIQQFAHKTLDELVALFGTAPSFRDWLDARKKIEEIREKDLKNDETVGRLIERDMVKRHVFGAIDNAFRRLLGDAPKTIARRLYAMAKSGATLEEAEAVVREVIGSNLAAVKSTAVRVLRG